MDTFYDPAIGANVPIDDLYSRMMGRTIEGVRRSAYLNHTDAVDILLDNGLCVTLMPMCDTTEHPYWIREEISEPLIAEEVAYEAAEKIARVMNVELAIASQ